MNAEEAIAHVISRHGLPALRTEQHRALSLILEGTNVFVSLPTGYGKSMVYSIAPLAKSVVCGKVTVGRRENVHCRYLSPTWRQHNLTY